MVKLKVFLALMLGIGFFGFSAAADQGSFLQPQEAINLVLSEPLQYVGSFFPRDSESGKIPSCLYRNSKVTVLYDYCTKSESLALGLTIHSNDLSRGNIRMYAEGSGRPVSQLERPEYLRYFWKIIVRPNSKGYRADLSAKEYSDYYEVQSQDQTLGCFIAEVMNHQGTYLNCFNEFEKQLASWGPSANVFWQKPSGEWYQMQKVFRRLVEHRR